MAALQWVLAGALLTASPVADVRIHVSHGSKKLAGASADLVRALSNVPGMSVVGSAADADVLVQVTERKRARTGRVVPIPAAAGIIVLPVREPRIVATVARDQRADTLSGRHRRSWSGAAEDLARQISAWSRP